MSTALRSPVLAAALAVLAFALTSAPALAADEFDKFAIELVSASLTSKQAGAHADMTIAVKLTRDGNAPYAKASEIKIELPPGVLGNPQAIPRCTAEQLGSRPQDSTCPFESQVGMTQVRVLQPFPGVYGMPVYNMVPPKGTDIVARLGFIAVGWPAFVNIRVDPTDYSLIASGEGLPAAAGISEAVTTIWGIPSDDSHDVDRVTPDEAANGGAPAELRSVPDAGPFIANPTDCSTQRQVRVSARSYQLPDAPPPAVTAPFPQITGCGKVGFAPSFTAALTNPEAAAPSGMDTELSMPQDESRQGLATSTLKSARVALPDGLAINPAAGDGLAACSAEQVGFEENVDAACPEAAKIGSIEAEVPALEAPLHGSVYQRTPEPGRLFGLWLVADQLGVHLKLPGRIEVDPNSGRLTAVFDGIPALGGLPQVPVSTLRLNVFGGPRAPLATPGGCGTYLTEFSFVPWSGNGAAEGSTPMEVRIGCGKGGFDPRIKAGSLNPIGGAYSPFAFTLTRQDGESNPETIALHMPQGLLAKLAGVPLCPEAAAASGACPAASRIGGLAAASGVGGAPLWIPQPGKPPATAYLAGPYKGAPYSIVSVVPAQAGPFDLGLVVNRAAIQIDPVTAQASILTDPLPQILEGVPVTYREIRVLVDRPEFTLNPTGCQPKEISATIAAAGGAVATPTTGFQATECAKLGFKPRLSLQLKGGTRRGDFPALRAVVRPRAGDANFAAVAVTLPHSAFLEQAHIGTICTRVQFAAGAGFGSQCPKASVYGRAKAISPLLDEPLTGIVYLRSNGGERELPDLVVALHGQIDIELSSHIDSVNGGIRSTFAQIPDAPVSRFVLEMQGGEKGLLVNSTDICRTAHRAAAKYTAHSGRRFNARVALKATGCKKKGKKKAGRHSG